MMNKGERCVDCLRLGGDLSKINPRLEPLTGVKLWIEMSKQLSDQRIHYHHGACKGYWNEYGRQKFGFNELVSQQYWQQLTAINALQFEHGGN
jgi:hypothetical protein